MVVINFMTDLIICMRIVGSSWVRLPDVQPKHVQAARKIRKLLKGDLNAKVCCVLFVETRLWIFLPTFDRLSATRHFPALKQIICALKLLVSLLPR